jgi:hypothetical protein
LIDPGKEKTEIENTSARNLPVHARSCLIDEVKNKNKKTNKKKGGRGK